MEYEVHVSLDDSMAEALEELLIFEFEEDLYEQDQREDESTR